ncbi:MAG: 30S ribosomal protein S8 [Solirubrobacterales bacterium]
MTDSTADFLTRLRNALIADRDDVVVQASGFNKELARLLEREGYIEGYEVGMKEPDGRRTRTAFEVLRVKLKYTEDRQPVISGLRRVSKPGRRQYATADDLPRVLGGMGTAIVTTSKGVLSANEARDKHVGGEVVAYVW